MKLAIYGAAGMIGARIVDEALDRGHHVTALVRTTGKLGNTEAGLLEVKADVSDAAQVAEQVRGHDAVICAISPRNERGPALMGLSMLSLAYGLPKAGVKRLLVVGGAGSLEVAPGRRLMDTPLFPDAYKAEAKAQAEALALLRLQDQLDWTYLSPAGIIQAGTRSGVFRVGGDQLLVDASGQSRISAEDYAVALLNEAEEGKHLRQRITVAYSSTLAIDWVFGLWYLLWIAAALSGAKKTVRRETLASMLFQRSFLAAGYFLLFVSLPAERRLYPAAEWNRWGGLGLCVAGLGYSLWARAALGNNWSGVVTLKEGHELVRTGPYAYSRHPIYTGLLCATAGVAMNKGTLYGGAGFLLVLVALHWKMYVEEQFMRSQFGASYALYSVQVKKILPYIY